jgi:hypothetical protein
MVDERTDEPQGALTYLVWRHAHRRRVFETASRRLFRSADECEPTLLMEPTVARRPFIPTKQMKSGCADGPQPDSCTAANSASIRSPRRRLPAASTER